MPKKNWKDGYMHKGKARSVCLNAEEDAALCAESERFTKLLQESTGSRIAKVGPVTLTRMIIVDWLRRRGYALRSERGLPAHEHRAAVAADRARGSPPPR